MKIIDKTGLLIVFISILYHWPHGMSSKIAIAKWNPAMPSDICFSVFPLTIDKHSLKSYTQYIIGYQLNELFLINSIRKEPAHAA